MLALVGTALLFCMVIVEGIDRKCGVESEYIRAIRYVFPNMTEPTFTVLEDEGNNSSSTEQSESRVSGDREPRITDGTKADNLRNFPWIADLSMVTILWDEINGTHPYYRHACGAAIISEYFLLTVAHCIRQTEKLYNSTDMPTHLRVSIGEFDQQEDDQFEEDYEIEEVKVHADFNLNIYQNLLANDIALIKLKPKNGSGIVFNEFIQTICLPTEHTPQIENSSLLIGGWGISRTEFDILSNYSRYIQYAEVPIRNAANCNRFCNRVNLEFYDENCLRPGQICAFHPIQGPDTCRGDSGSPVVQNINGRFTLIGLTSFGDPTCNNTLPAIYTGVRHFLPWILSSIDELMNTESTSEMR